MFDLNLRNYGYLELFVCIVLNVLGLIFIQSSLSTTANRLISQLMISIVSLMICIIISFLNLKKAINRPFAFFWLSVISLFILRISGTAFGRNSVRWINIPIINSQLQPSEFVKLFVILFISKYIEKMGIMINRFGNLMKVIALFAVPFIMILAQPNLSSSLILLFIFMAMLFSSELDLKWFIGGATTAIVIVLSIYVMATNGLIYSLPVLEDYQKQRIVSFVNPAEGDQGTYQQENSVTAIGSGKILGKGINNDSTQSVKNGNWLAEEQNDFIFAVVGEEVGFLGSTIIILLYIFLVVSCFVIAGRQREVYRKLICVGVGTWIGAQCFVNIGVATSIIPNTGVPLPFFSQGGSSLLSVYMGMGFVINIKREVRV